MRDLTSPTWIHFKGFLFLLLGATCAVMLVREAPSPRVALLLALTVWSFCRLYYFAFYVIERYVDPSYRFSGLLSFAHYLFKKKYTLVQPRGSTPRKI